MEEKNRRKERLEEEERRIECERHITRVRVYADFSNWGVIVNQSPKHVTAEDVRERSASIVVNILNQASNIAHAYGIRLVYYAVGVVNTAASMRCVFNGENWKGQSNVFREREVEALILTHSNSSAKSLQNLNKAVRLRFLFLDGCPLKGGPAGGKDKMPRGSIESFNENVFELLTNSGPVPSLECLSIVGTSSQLSSTWLDIVGKMCPKLKVVYFTRKIGEKALGWSDVVMMQAMREPRLLPCGHVGDAPSLAQMRTRCCPMCRTPFHNGQLVSLEASVTQVTRVDDGSWKATIVDTLRTPLDEKVVYHACGEFYNLSSLHRIYEATQKFTEIDQTLFDTLSTEHCVRCSRLMHTLHVCYPRSATADEANFESLQQASSYIVTE